MELFRRLFQRAHPDRQPKTLYLHIGMPKTGTSAIQDVLFANTEALAANGTLYPKATLGGDADFAYAHHTLAKASLEKDSRAWNPLLAELKKSAFQRIILSSEAFSNCRHDNQLAFIHKKLEKFDVKIIIYLRRQDDLVQALYQTHIIYGEMTLPFDNYYTSMLENQQQHRSMDYFFLVDELWSREFGKENIVVRPYEKPALRNSDLLQDFLYVTQVTDTAPFNFDLPNHNRSFDARTLEIYRKIKLVFADQEDNLTDIRRYLRDNNQRSAFLPNNIMSAAQSAQLMSTVAESNKQVAKTYLGREDGQLFSSGIRKKADDFNPATIGNKEVITVLQAVDPQLAKTYQQRTAQT